MSDPTKYLLDTINKYAEALRRIEKELPEEYWDFHLYDPEVTKAFMNINHHVREALYTPGRTSCSNISGPIKELSGESH